MTSYKRCDSLLNCETCFIKRFYPIYYNVILYLLWLNVGKTKKSEFRAQISQDDGSLIPGFVKQRIWLPDTLFFYAQAGRLGGATPNNGVKPK